MSEAPQHAADAAHSSVSDPTAAALCVVQQLTFSYPGKALLSGLSFTVHPGLTLVRGGDGRGKSTLLRLLAGSLPPSAGVVQRRAQTLFHESPEAAEHDSVVASAWLAARSERFAGWQADQAAALINGFGLAEHMAKPLYMLSTGSRRKVGLVAAAASGAQLTLIDTPFAALDARSGRLLATLLVQAAASPTRAWVLADHELPPSLAGVRLAGCIDLGD